MSHSRHQACRNTNKHAWSIFLDPLLHARSLSYIIYDDLQRIWISGGRLLGPQRENHSRREVYLVDRMGKGQIGYATFYLMPRLARKMPCVYEYRRRNRLVELVAGFLCCLFRVSSVQQKRCWEAFRQTCQSFISPPIKAQACKFGLSGCGADDTLPLPAFDKRFGGSS